MGKSPQRDVAEQLGDDDSTVWRYLNELVDQGLLQKFLLNRKADGHVNVYHSIDLAETRRETLVWFYARLSRRPRSSKRQISSKRGISMRIV